MKLYLDPSTMGDIKSLATPIILGLPTFHLNLVSVLTILLVHAIKNISALPIVTYNTLASF